MYISRRRLVCWLKRARGTPLRPQNVSFRPKKNPAPNIILSLLILPVICMNLFYQFCRLCAYHFKPKLSLEKSSTYSYEEG